MKPQNKNALDVAKQGRIRKYWLEGLAIVVSIAVIAGCNKQNGNNAATPATSNPNAYQPGMVWSADVSQCNGCFPNPQPLLIGVKATDPMTANSVLMSLDILGAPIPNLNYADPKIVNYYNGPVMVVGAMRITAQNSLTCNAPPGDYTIRTVTPGTMTMTGINNVVVDAYSQNSNPPARFYMMMNPIVVYNDSGLGLSRANDSNRAGISIRIDSIMTNGVAGGGYGCGSVFTTQ